MEKEKELTLKFYQNEEVPCDLPALFFIKYRDNTNNVFDTEFVVAFDAEDAIDTITELCEGQLDILGITFIEGLIFHSTKVIKDIKEGK